ncbi:MAG: TonB-dependent receptor plug [Gemmatimonadetes bacterium]|nr:TonB-dependent receptor plug [Gemmatimonadota bacterium]
MYTLSSPINMTRRTAIAFAIVLGAPAVQAQDPVRIRGVEVTAKRPGPGPQLFGGLVTDTAAFPLEGVEIIIPGLLRRISTKADGSFRMDSMPRGTYSVRARKIGYAPQVREIEVAAMGAAMDFALVPAPRALPSVVVSAVRGGLSGTVADTAYDYVAGADVTVLGKDLRAVTDSTGSFYLPAPEGHYMVSLHKDGYKDRLVSVTVPGDSGRRIAAFLQPAAQRAHVEAWNVPDLEQRMAWRSKQSTAFYTREDLKKLDIDWVYDAMNMGGQKKYDADCSVVVDGGPNTVKVNTLTVDDIEAIEVYSILRAGGNPNAQPPSLNAQMLPRKGGQPKKPIMRPVGVASSSPPIPISNTGRAESENLGKTCPRAVYIWSR